MTTTPTTQAIDFAELARLIVAAAAADRSADGRRPIAGTEEAGARPPAAETEDEAQAEPSADGAGPGVRRLEDLPRELGVLLASVGVLGFVLPGVAGAPALLAGGLVLWPRTFGKVEGWFSRRCPAVHRKSMQQVGRFLDDLDRRYPQSDNHRP